MLVAAGLGEVVVEKTVHMPAWLAAPDTDSVKASDAEGWGHGDEDELDINGNPFANAAVATAEPEPVSELTSTWVGSIKDIHRLLTGYGEHGSMVMVGSWKRSQTGELTPHEHVELGRTQRVTGVWRSEYDLDNGGGHFVVGRPSGWRFSDGIGTFESGAIATAWRFNGQAKPARAISVDQDLVQRQVSDAVALVGDAMSSVLADLESKNPAEALAGWTDAATLLFEQNRVLDAGAMVARELAAEEWLVAKDAEFPGLLDAEVRINDEYSAKFTRGLVFAEKRLAEYVAVRRNAVGIGDHIEDLRAALRGLAASSRILRERQARAGGVAE